MRVLFLTLAGIQSIAARGIYTDLIREFRDRGDLVTIVCPVERRFGTPTALSVEQGVEILRVRTGNITKTSLVEKGLSTLLLESQFRAAIENNLSGIEFDLVMYSTPPITFERVVRYVKRQDGCKSYLLLKDIFPQNAVDVGMFKTSSPLYRYFRAKEKRLYALSDWIGCMSEANVRYLLAQNPEIPADKVEVCPNSIEPVPLSRFSESKGETRDALGIPRDAVAFVFGGNLGRPQGLDFLLKVLDRMKNRPDLFFLIVGSGTEYGRIDVHLRVGGHQNAKLMKMLPKEQYDSLMCECDIGLIFLDPRFTIPNFPSRLTAYMEAAKPVIAATDTATDLGEVLTRSGSGIWVRNGDLEGFEAAVDRLVADADLRKQMGLRGRAYLEEHYTVSRAYGIITAHFRSDSEG
jgi:glycosyltransferase involved in cell wall biosynthesis